MASFQYLGVTIENNLKFNLHIKNIASSVSKAAGVLYSLRNFFPEKTLKNIFYSTIYSKVNLHILAWGKSPDTVLQPLRVAINKAVRSISPPVLGESTGELNVWLNLLNFNQILQMKILQFMYKEHHRQSSMFFYVRNDFFSASFI